METNIEKLLSTYSVARQEGDYEYNGLLHCGKCNTPKQCIVEIMGQNRKMPCLCKCKIEKRKADYEMEMKQKEAERINALREKAFKDKKMQKMKNWRFESQDTLNDMETIAQAKNYCANFEYFFDRGTGLILSGDVGRGKSYIACCIANRIIESKRTTLLTTISSVANEMFSEIEKEDFMYNIGQYDLLVIDDFSVERSTPYMNEIAYNVINARYTSQKPVIITTNLSFSKLKNPDTEEKKRIYSRILEMCIPLNIVGDDLRRIKAKENYESYMKILNGEGD